MKMCSGAFQLPRNNLLSGRDNGEGPGALGLQGPLRVVVQSTSWNDSCWEHGNHAGPKYLGVGALAFEPLGDQINLSGPRPRGLGFAYHDFFE